MQVSAASESLSKGLIEQLTSLNPGEAILVGQWVNLPTFVKVDEIKEHRTGSDQNAVEEWEKLAAMKQIVRESSDSYVPSGYIEE
jgi:DNA helicase HerA-like ATPase